jgi:putative transposase
MRDVLDANFYLLRTGCQWRYLPRDFPPRSTVWGYFDEWRHNGTWDAIHGALRDRVRQREKPGRPRRTASIDSQSVDTSSGGEARGRDNAKNVDGRKHHIVVDSLGLLLAVAVTAADVDEVTLESYGPLLGFLCTVAGAVGVCLLTAGRHRHQLGANRGPTGDGRCRS